MQTSKLNAIKNALWAIGIAVCLAAVAVGLLFSAFHRDRSAGESFAPILGANTTKADEPDLFYGHTVGTGNGAERGELKILKESEDGGAEYLSRITYLVDSTFIGLRTKGITDEKAVWGTVSGSMQILSAPTATIKFPNDGSEITPAAAAMVAKPDILVIGIGADGVSKADQESFIEAYDSLIWGIQDASPDTTIICMGVCSVVADYSGVDGLNVRIMSDANDWVQIVCRDTGAYFLDVDETMGDGAGSIFSKYCEANGKTLNKAGLTEVLYAIQTHTIP